MLVKEVSEKKEQHSALGTEGDVLLNKKVFDALGFLCEEKSTGTPKRMHRWQIVVRDSRGRITRIEVPSSRSHCYTTDSLEHLIREGFPIISGENMKRTLALADEELAEMIGISLRTLHRKRKEGKSLSMVESDRLYRLARIYAKATRTLQNDEMAREWLKRPQRGLAGRIPMKVIETEAGAQEVEDLLGRIEYGVIA